MFEDIIRTITIILLLLSGYLILKKIIELDERLTALEKSTLEIKKENYEEEYSTDHLFHMLKNNNPEIIQENIRENVREIVRENDQEIVQENVRKNLISPIIPDVSIIISEQKSQVSPTFTETVVQFSDSEINEELQKKYNKMKLKQLQEICNDLNIELQINGKNKSKKVLIKEIISQLNNNG
jgi:hypothetical protein